MIGVQCMKKCDDFFLKNRPKFLFGAVNEGQFSKCRLPEIAFIGKSNVGKSSLINAITYSDVARTSKTPGRTRELNFFNIGDRVNFVDMPGYGFAMVAEEEKHVWYNFINEYLTHSKNLSKLFLLIDCRRGVKANDFEFMQLLDELSICFQIILTKIDSNSKEEVSTIVDGIKRESINHKTMSNVVLCCSSVKNYGISEVRNEVYKTIFNL
jgi:GTP-binding protein